MNVSMRYGSHIPLLLAVMERTGGDVLELGAGVFSTPLMHWLCERRGRNLLTIESDKEWIKFCSQFFRTDHHKFIRVRGWDDAKPVISKEWDVALVDHSPSARRVEELKILAPLVKYVVLHDTEPWKERDYHYSTIYPLYKYIYQFTGADHYTSVLSNFVDLKDFSIYAA